MPDTAPTRKPSPPLRIHAVTAGLLAMLAAAGCGQSTAVTLDADPDFAFDVDAVTVSIDRHTADEIEEVLYLFAMGVGAWDIGVDNVDDRYDEETIDDAIFDQIAEIANHWVRDGQRYAHIHPAEAGSTFIVSVNISQLDGPSFTCRIPVDEATANALKDGLLNHFEPYAR